MAYLDGKDVQTLKHDLAKEPPSRELLDRLIDEDRLDDFLNPRSPAYKTLGLGSRKLTKKQAIDLILEDPNLMRRPLIVSGRRAVFGFRKDEIDEMLRK